MGGVVIIFVLTTVTCNVNWIALVSACIVVKQNALGVLLYAILVLTDAFLNVLLDALDNAAIAL